VRPAGPGDPPPGAFDQLRQHIVRKNEPLEETLRRVVREELNAKDRIGK